MVYDELIKLTLGGLEQWIYIRGKKKDSPVLIFLHGGPGFPGIAVSLAYQQRLEDDFTVIQWDQRGAGKTFSNSKQNQKLRVDLYLSDLFQLLDYVRHRFGKEKVYLMGHSWGSLLGMLAIKQAPHRFLSYISIAQFVNMQQNAQLVYEYCFQKAGEMNDRKLIESILQLGIADTSAKWALANQYVTMLGGALYNQNDMEFVGRIFFSSTLYTDVEKQNIPHAMQYSCIEMYDEMLKYDLLTDVCKVDVPVLFLSGKNDYLCVMSLVKKYFEMMTAPQKKMILFDQSAHFPFLEESDHFASTVCEWFQH